MYYRLFFCLAAWSLQDAPKASRLPPRPLPDVPRRPKWGLGCPQDLLQTSPGAPKSVQAAPKTSPRRPQALPKNSLKVPNHSTSYAYSLHLLPTCAQGPRLEGQGQRSQIRGPGFMVGSAGPRRVCSDPTTNNRSLTAGVKPLYSVNTPSGGKRVPKHW